MGYVLFFIVDLAFFISLLVLIYYWLRRRKNKKVYQKKFLYSTLASVVLLFLLGGTSQLIPTNNSEKSASNESSREKTQESSTKEKNNSDETSDNDSYTQEQIKKINHQLVLALKDDQKDANNGNKKYNWSLYLLKIEIQKNKSAYVYVDGNFMDLSEENRKIVGEHTNGLIGAAIATAGIDYSPEEGREGVYMSFYNGPQAIGHSKFSDHVLFKWYKY